MVNPWNARSFAAALLDALNMSEQERAERHAYAYRYCTKHSDKMVRNPGGLPWTNGPNLANEILQEGTKCRGIFSHDSQRLCACHRSGQGSSSPSWGPFCGHHQEMRRQLETLPLWAPQHLQLHRKQPGVSMAESGSHIPFDCSSRL